MEIELKYTISEPETAEKIWQDADLKQMEEESTRDSSEFRGTYYDTDDYVLFRNDIAFRMRQEGKKLVASLKWNGKSTGALHEREELNMNLGEGSVPKQPDPSVFCESEEGREMQALIGDKPLSCMIQVNVLRRSFRIDTGDSILELSLDDGNILTQNGSEPVHEMEIELFSGEVQDLEKIGKMLEKKYQLQAEQDSKFARGLKLLEMI